MKDNFDIGTWKKKILLENLNEAEPVDEMASTGRLLEHPEYQALVSELEEIIQDKVDFKQVSSIVLSIGELALDIGYSNALKDGNTIKQDKKHDAYLKRKFK